MKAVLIRRGATGIIILGLLWMVEYLSIEREFILNSPQPKTCDLSPDHHHMTALMMAAEKGDPAWVKRLMALRCDIKARDQNGQTALHYAAMSGEPFGTTVRILVSGGAELEARDKYGNTPLLLSFDPHGSFGVTLALLQAGANPNIQDVTGASPLLRATQDDDFVTARLLLRRGADPNLRKIDGSTILMEAARLGNIDMVELLLKHGANKTLTDATGRRASDFAASPEKVFITDSRSRERFRRIADELQ